MLIEAVEQIKDGFFYDEHAFEHVWAGSVLIDIDELIDERTNHAIFGVLAVGINVGGEDLWMIFVDVVFDALEKVWFDTNVGIKKREPTCLSIFSA